MGADRGLLSPIGVKIRCCGHVDLMRQQLPLLLLASLCACSVINNADDFRTGDGGVSADASLDDGGDAQGCLMDEDCIGLPNAAPYCDPSSGACGLGACENDFGDCDGASENGCEASLITPEQCGQCNRACAADAPFCSGGECVPDCGDQTLCDGSCVDLQNSESHCGECGNVCDQPPGASSVACVEGRCTPACAPFLMNCDGDAATGCEADLRSDSANCGGCNVACGEGVSCVNGHCDPYTKVSTQGDHACALRESGAIDCWGRNESREAGGTSNRALEEPTRMRWDPPGPETMMDVQALDVAVGDSVTCFVSAHRDSQGRIYCAGSDSLSRRGGAPGSPNWPPQPVSAIPSELEFSDVEHGGFFGCGITLGGHVWCWGDNRRGQTGSPNIEDYSTRAVSFSRPVSDIALGTSTLCALLDDGGVECLGANDQGQLGRGSFSNDLFFSAAAVEVTVGEPLSGIRDLVGNSSEFCAISEGNELFCWGHAASVQSLAVSVASGVEEVAVFHFATCWWSEAGGGVSCRGRRDLGAFGDAAPSEPPRDRPAAAPELNGLSEVDGGFRGGCGLDGSGELQCWGHSVYGTVLRSSLIEEEPAPVVGMDSMPVVGLSNLAMGREGTCAVQGGNAYCWGSGARTDFGNNQNISYPYPFQIPRLTNVTDVARSDFGGACAIGEVDGVSGLYCWSSNARGRLGAIGRSAPTPTLVPGISSPSQVEMATGHTCAIVANDEVMCWGANDFGQIGIPAVERADEPPTFVMEGDSRIRASQLTLGAGFACALLTGEDAGSAVCWGAGALGQLGHGSSPESAGVVRVALTNVTAIEAGRQHACAIGGSPAQVHCWGQNNLGQAGIGSTGNIATPMPTDFSGVLAVGVAPVSVAAGAFASCAAFDDDSVFCWGDNTYSELGSPGGSTSTPRIVPGLSATSVAAGSALDWAFCAGTEEGRVHCWGLNDNGKLGTSPEIYFSPQEVFR